MTLPYVIVNADEVFADGLALHLARGGDPPLVREEPPSPDDWLRGPAPRAVLAVIQARVDGDGGWDLLEQLGRVADDGRLTVVALLPDSSTVALREALARGATAALPARTPPADLAAAVRFAVKGYCVALAPQSQAIASMRLAVEDQDDVELTEQHCDWLRRLRDNESAAAIARDIGYSERHFRRKLAAVYLELGARTRIEALTAAARRGLLY